MKVVDIKCPGCGAELHILGDRTECFCEYCGSKILLDDGSVKNVTVIRDEVKLKELQIEEERIKEAKAKLEEYKILAEEQKAKKRFKDRLVLITWITTLVLFFIGLNVLPNDNDIVRYCMTAFGALQMIMVIAVPCYLISKPGYVAQYEQQEKLIKALEYNRILNNKQNKN